VVAGPGAALVADAGAAKPAETFGSAAGGPLGVDPVVLARLAQARAAKGDAVPPDPLYLRRPHVQAPGPGKRATR
jgi:tRNA threonylcarbamoyladenosine biosynthesis protein TsaB